MAEKTALAIREPTFHLDRPGQLQKLVWGFKEAFGYNMRESREVVAAKLYDRGLDVYRRDVGECKAVADGFKGVYQDIRKKVNESEMEVRDLEARLGQPVEVDMQKLGCEAELRNLSGTSEVQAFLDSLRADLSAIEQIDLALFKQEYGVAPDVYLRAGESMLGQLEDALDKQVEAEALVGQKKAVLASLRKEREDSFKVYMDAKVRIGKMEGMLTLLETKGAKRALLIRAAENADRLEAGTEYLVGLYGELAGAEAEARSTLAQYTPWTQLLEDHAQAIEATAAEIVGEKNNGK